MKWLLIIPFLNLMACGGFLVPDVVTIEDTLDNGLQALLELGIQEEACRGIEEKGYECNIPEQIHSIKFTWYHDYNNTVVYKLKFCLKENCPLEEQ